MIIFSPPAGEGFFKRDLPHPEILRPDFIGTQDDVIRVIDTHSRIKYGFTLNGSP